MRGMARYYFKLATLKLWEIIIILIIFGSRNIQEKSISRRKSRNRGKFRKSPETFGKLKICTGDARTSEPRSRDINYRALQARRLVIIGISGIIYRYLMSERHSLSISHKKQSRNLSRRTTLLNDASLSCYLWHVASFKGRSIYVVLFQVYRYRMSEDRSPGQASGSFFREFSGSLVREKRESRSTTTRSFIFASYFSSPSRASSINYQSHPASSFLINLTLALRYINKRRLLNS